MALSFPVRPFAEHVPDAGPDADHLNPSTVEPGAGMIEFGFYLGDHRVVLSSLKAGAFTELFENGDPTTGKPAASATDGSSSSSSDADKARIAELEAQVAELEAAQSAQTQGDTPPPAQ